MARIFENSTCAICEHLLKDDDQEWFGTSGVFFEPHDPLEPYCDAPIHWNCYETWPYRERFAATHFESLIMIWAVLADRDNGYALNISKRENEIGINPIEIGIPVNLELSSYDHWIHNPEDILRAMHPLKQRAIRRIIPILYQRFPTLEALMLGTQKRQI